MLVVPAETTCKLKLEKANRYKDADGSLRQFVVGWMEIPMID